MYIDRALSARDLAANGGYTGYRIQSVHTCSKQNTQPISIIFLSTRNNHYYKRAHSYKAIGHTLTKTILLDIEMSISLARLTSLLLQYS